MEKPLIKKIDKYDSFLFKTLLRDINQFHVTGFFLQPMKTFLLQKTCYRKRSIAKNRLRDFP